MWEPLTWHAAKQKHRKTTAFTMVAIVSPLNFTLVDKVAGSISNSVLACRFQSLLEQIWAWLVVDCNGLKFSVPDVLSDFSSRLYLYLKAAERQTHDKERERERAAVDDLGVKTVVCLVSFKSPNFIEESEGSPTYACQRGIIRPLQKFTPAVVLIIFMKIHGAFMDGVTACLCLHANSRECREGSGGSHWKLFWLSCLHRWLVQVQNDWKLMQLLIDNHHLWVRLKLLDVHVGHACIAHTDRHCSQSKGHRRFLKTSTFGSLAGRYHGLFLVFSWADLSKNRLKWLHSCHQTG